MKNRGFAASGILYTILLIFLAVVSMLLMNLKNKKNLLDQLKNEALYNTEKLCAAKINQTYDFDYTGNIEEFVAECEGEYKLEVWGAQGGSSLAGGAVKDTGGYGGYSVGYVNLRTNNKLYVGVGGAGGEASLTGCSTGGYNGGGKGTNDSGSCDASPDDEAAGGGGGATHIASNNRGVLSQYSSYRNEIYIIAGGGGGGSWTFRGGSGGGIEGGIGGATASATQTSGNAFGVGQDASGAGNSNGIGGGGGGWYGGYMGAGNASDSSGSKDMSGGGSGYIANPMLSSKKMVCYNCTTSNNINTKTESNECHNGEPTEDCAKEGNGHARITYLGKNHCGIEPGTTFTFDYTGGVQEYTADCDGVYKVELWGAQGSNGTGADVVGGLGGYTSGNITLKSNTTLYIYNGASSNSTQKNVKTFNNGTSSSGGFNGGGATDIRLVNGDWDNFDSLKSRIMVAGGGGTKSSSGVAGAGGGLVGYDASTEGGTQFTFGETIYSPQSSFGVANGGCTGGNGYYPGAGATCANGSGGGSSFISGHYGCDAIDESSTSSNIIHTNQPIHYSGLYFTDTRMVDGQGYSWTNTKSGKTNMPNHEGTGTMIGNSGNGYTKITYLGKDYCSMQPGQEFTFDYVGSAQEFTAECKGTYRVELWGAQGGSYEADGTGEKGAYTAGDISLLAGTKLYVYVGQGEGGRNEPAFNATTTSTGSGTPGGGATDIRLYSDEWNNALGLRSRIMVAAGGGSNQAGKWGGAGGGLVGYSSVKDGKTNTGGTQTSGGIYSAEATTCGFGSFGSGSTCGATGGGGYYGGSGAAHANGSGAGGSSYISGHIGCVAIKSETDQTPKSGCETGTTDDRCSIHYSNYIFTNTRMIDGEGYEWTYEKAASSTGMPNHAGTATMTGNSGHGYAKITYLGNT